MYAKYTYTSTSTIDQILSDITAIFTGQTDINNLSVSCDKTVSQIITTYSVSPYALYHDLSGVKKIIRVEVDDDLGRYKYISLNHDGVDDIAFSVMESWDIATSTGTNEVATNYDKTSMRVYPTAGGTMHLYGDQYSVIMMHQSTADLFGSAGSDPTYGSIGVFECTRDHPSMKAGDMPNWFVASTAMIWGDSDLTMKAYFYKGRDYTGVEIAPLTAELGYAGRDNQYSDTNSYNITGIGVEIFSSINDTKGFGFYLEPIVIGGSTSRSEYNATTYMGEVSARCDIWFLAPSTRFILERLLVDDKPYIIFKTGYTGATVGRSVGGKFIVPYG